MYDFIRSYKTVMGEADNEQVLICHKHVQPRALYDFYYHAFPCP